MIARDPAPCPAAAGAAEALRPPIERLIDHCTAQVVHCPSEALSRRVALFGGAFEDALRDSPASTHRIFTFHLPVPGEHAKISYVDCAHDHHEFDYDGILRHFVRSAAATNPGAQVVLVTGPDSAIPPFETPVTVVRLKLDPARLMFERVVAMTSLVTCAAPHSGSLALLDTDAFLNAPLDQVFRTAFDVAVTERPSEGFYMPVNEGVIFAKHEQAGRAAAFFRTLLATYERLIDDPVVTAYYGDITRWRGGQLALNAVARHYRAGSRESHAPRVASLPCAFYNFWVEPNLTTQPGAWCDKATLHLKGDSKHLFAAFRDEHLQVLERSVRLRGAGAEGGPARAFSVPVRTPDRA